MSDPAGRVPKSYDEAVDELVESKRHLAYEFLRPQEQEGRNAADLFGRLGAVAVGEAGGMRVDEGDLTGMSDRDWLSLVALLLDRTARDVRAVRPGEAPGAQLVARDGSSATAVRVVSPRAPLSPVDMAAVAGARDVLSSRTQGAHAELWTVVEVPTPLAREAARNDVRTVSRPDVCRFLRQHPVALRDLWEREARLRS